MFQAGEVTNGSPVNVGVVSTKPWMPPDERLIGGVQDVKRGQLIIVS